MATYLGASAIATALGLRTDQVRYLAKTGRLPHFHIGKRICSTQPMLAEWQAQNIAKAAPAVAAN